MSNKEQHSTKEAKKKPLLNAKEKRAAKRAKKQAKKGIMGSESGARVG